MREAVPGLALGGEDGAEIRGYAAQELGIGRKYWGWPRMEWFWVVGSGFVVFGVVGLGMDWWVGLWGHLRVDLGVDL